MSAMASQITCPKIVFTQPFIQITGLCAGNTLVSGEFPLQSASNVKNVSI